MGGFLRPRDHESPKKLNRGLELQYSSSYYAVEVQGKMNERGGQGTCQDFGIWHHFFIGGFRRKKIIMSYLLRAFKETLTCSSRAFALTLCSSPCLILEVYIYAKCQTYKVRLQFFQGQG